MCSWKLSWTFSLFTLVLQRLMLNWDFYMWLEGNELYEDGNQASFLKGLWDLQQHIREQDKKNTCPFPTCGCRSRASLRSFEKQEQPFLRLINWMYTATIKTPKTKIRTPQMATMMLPLLAGSLCASTSDLNNPPVSKMYW